MSRLATLLLALVLAAAGLVGVAGPAAAACPYAACIATTTKISAPNSVKQGAKVTVTVKVSVAGNAQPRGRVTVTINGPGGYSFSDSVSYDGGRVSVTSSKLKKPGKYKISARFSPDPGTVWKASHDTDGVTVRKARRPI